ncbi:glycoside hydrolase family 3 protein [Aeromonas sobria]|uniref:beta-N-acetylhexosaminidase n=1 Tax=Aeromonas sobria TaxID=646 RepID=A0A1S2D1F8_AERSO|nr:glycoside hydrolase family 3 protein [Aeromonas sobria]MBS4687860.1 glycoside hydrolase family 3 protein [Aeromonas sobria]OHY94782.1 glycosyl hydrolase [Aeromonas sobria]
MKKLAPLTSLLLAMGANAAPLAQEKLQILWQQPQQSAQQIIDHMSLREMIGQTLMLDFRAWGKDDKEQPIPFNVMNKEVTDIIYKYRLGSVILFRENLITTEQTVKLINDIQAARDGLPLFISVDQEGGYVTRLREGTEMPGNMALGATRNPALAELSGMIHGAELASLGFNLNFGPVVDVNSNQNNPVIGVRSYSDEHPMVTTMANSYVKGIHKYNILTSAKHFPGHGNVAVDSHFGLPEVPYSVKEWSQTDLPPFVNTLANGVDTVMTAHVVFPSLDDSKLTTLKGEKMGTPATLSKKIIDGVLRKQLKFDGLVLTDAMDMGAISSNFDMNWAVATAYKAGVDMPLMPIPMWGDDARIKLDNLYGYLTEQADQDPELKARIKESAKRVVLSKLKNRIDAEPKDVAKALAVVASAQHKQFEDMVAENAVTLIKNDGVLPVALNSGKKILVISDEQPRSDMMTKHIQNLAKQLDLTAVETTARKVTLMNNDLDTEALQRDIAHNDLVILATYNLAANPVNAQKIINIANKASKKLVVISTRNPYDIAYLNGVQANMAIYGITGFDITNNNRNSLETNIKAGILTLFKNPDTAAPLNNPTGKLPVNIKTEDGKNVLFPINHGLNF